MTLLSKWYRAIRDGRRRLSGVAKSLSISVVNQVVSSGMNFVLGLYLVRVLTPSEFGLYGIGFAIVLFYAGVGNSLFLMQMVVHVPEKAPGDRLPYAARMLVALLAFCGLTVVLATIVWAVGKQIFPPLNEYARSFFAVLAASLAYVLKDFFVRHAYTARHEIWALAMNSLIAIVLAVSLVSQRQAESSIDAAEVLWVFAMSNLWGVILGFALVRLPLFSVTIRETLADWREAWLGGAWALGGGLVIWSQSQAYVYLTAAIAGSAAVGMANAARLVITPALFFLTAANQLLLPRLATLRVTNFNGMIRMSENVALAFVIFALLYSALFIILGDGMLSLIIGDKYQDIGTLVIAWCLVLLFQFSRIGTTAVLQVLKQFRRIMLDNLWSAFTAILLSVFLLRLQGVLGAVVGTACGELILSFLLYRAVRASKLGEHIPRTKTDVERPMGKGR